MVNESHYKLKSKERTQRGEELKEFKCVRACGCVCASDREKISGRLRSLFAL